MNSGDLHCLLEVTTCLFYDFMQFHPKMLPCAPSVLAVQSCPARLCANQNREVDVAEIKPLIFFPPWISFQMDKFLNQFQNTAAQMLIPA